MSRLWSRTGAVSVFLALGTSEARAQWAQVHEQFYLPATHNWEFRDRYAGADRLFNAFDYGHAILYEVLYTRPEDAVARLEQKEYDFITRRLLVRPPRVPLEEAAIEVQYAKLAPEAKAMFEWAHILHRQIYDVLADESLSEAAKDAEIAILLRYYKSRPELRFSSQPKTMELMEGHPYSTAFRKQYPKFNGLIWAYHWLQVGLYEPLLIGSNADERQSGVAATVSRFRQMLHDAPTYFPYVMPMTAAVAPTFAARYPEAAIIFDNLHSMHDVISDILASSEVPRARKRAEILRAAGYYRDDTSYVTTEAGWREMAAHMGIQNMGGPAVGFLPGFPTPTVARGATMAEMQHAQHAPTVAEQHQHSPATPAAPPAAQHQHPPATPTPPAAQHEHAPADSADAAARAAMAFVVRLLDDPAVEQRIHSDPRLHALWSSPEVQACLKEMRALRAAGRPLPARCPPAPPVPVRKE